MRHVVVERPGGHQALTIREAPDPEVKPGCCRVRVSAAGVNFADTIVREGYYKAAKGKFPIVPGFEFSGTVDATGDGCQALKVGDEVFGYTVFGGYSSVQVAPEAHLRKIPQGWTALDCAAIPAVHLTAYHALVNTAHVSAGAHILVHSAAGGVGLAILQQAKAKRCDVTAVVGSAEKIDTARGFGADRVVVKSKSMWDEIDRVKPDGFDAVFDPNGISTPRPGFNRLKPGGRLVVYGFGEVLPKGRRPWLAALALNVLRIPRFSPFEMTSENRAVMGLNLAFLADHSAKADLAFNQICSWMSANVIKPAPLTTFKVEHVAEAHKLIESGKSVGKIVLKF